MFPTATNHQASEVLGVIRIADHAANLVDVFGVEAVVPASVRRAGGKDKILFYQFIQGAFHNFLFFVNRLFRQPPFENAVDGIGGIWILIEIAQNLQCDLRGRVALTSTSRSAPFHFAIALCTSCSSVNDWFFELKN